MYFKTLLHQERLKITPARKAVLNFFAKNKIPLDAESIYTHLVEEHSKVNKATVYRILNVFVKKGIVQRLEFGEGKYRYELRANDHHHLICENCYSVTDILNCEIDNLTREIKKEKGFLVKRHNLEFYGLCLLCQR